MSFADLRIVAIAIILAVTYSTFLFLNASQNTPVDYTAGISNTSQYDTPDSGSFFDNLQEIGKLQSLNPEIFFMNTILFGTIAFLLVFVGLRFLRGTG